MSVFERYLTVWVFLCILVGIALGHLMPSVFQTIGAAEIAKVNIPVAVLIWLMVIPMLLKIDFAALGEVGCHWRGIGVTLFINWAVKPFSMALLGKATSKSIALPVLVYTVNDPNRIKALLQSGVTAVFSDVTDVIV